MEEIEINREEDLDEAVEGAGTGVVALELAAIAYAPNAVKKCHISRV